MGQSRTESLIEALLNQTVGMGYAILFYWYMFGFTVVQGLSTTAFFVCAGLVRVFLIRRGFVWWKRRKTA
jgi:hypothetical protein